MTLDRESLTENELEEAKRIALEIARLKNEADEKESKNDDGDSSHGGVGRVLGGDSIETFLA